MVGRSYAGSLHYYAINRREKENGRSISSPDFDALQYFLDHDPSIFHKFPNDFLLDLISTRDWWLTSSILNDGHYTMDNEIRTGEEVFANLLDEYLQNCSQCNLEETVVPIDEKGRGLSLAGDIVFNLCSARPPSEILDDLDINTQAEIAKHLSEVDIATLNFLSNAPNGPNLECVEKLLVTR